MRLSRYIILILCFALLLPFVSCAQQNKIDSLFSLLKSDKQDTTKVKHLVSICWNYYLQGELNKAIGYADSAMVLAQRLNYSVGYARACTDKGNILLEKGEYSKVWNLFNKAIDIFTQVGYKESLLTVKDNIGDLFAAQGNYPKALEYHLGAISEAEKYGFKNAISSFMSNTGTVYLYEGDYDKALEYYNKSLSFDADEIHDRHNLATTLGNIGLVYDDKKDYPNAKRYYGEAYKIEEEEGNPEGMARNTFNIGTTFSEEGDYSKALENYAKSMATFRKLGDSAKISLIMTNMAEAYLQQKNYKKCEEYALKAYSKASEMAALTDIRDNAEILSSLYERTGLITKAFDYYKQYVAAKDSLVNEAKTKEIGRIEAKSEFDKQLALQQADDEKKQAIKEGENKRQRIIILLIAAIALAAIAIAINIFRVLKTTRKQKIVAEKQKIEQELKALRAQMNPHFIFNAINSIKNFVLENDSVAASRHLSKFSKLIREVLENSKYEYISLAKELQMLELYMELESLRFAQKFNFKVSIDTHIDAENVLISPLIIQPYVENAIWHGIMHLKNANGEVTIRIEDAGNDFLKCIIDDNGIGREESMKLKQNRTHNSMGLSLTKERVEIINSMHKARLSVNVVDKVQDGKSAGTRIELFLPLVKKEF